MEEEDGETKRGEGLGKEMRSYMGSEVVGGHSAQLGTGRSPVLNAPPPTLNPPTR